MVSIPESNPGHIGGRQWIMKSSTQTQFEKHAKVHCIVVKKKEFAETALPRKYNVIG